MPTRLKHLLLLLLSAVARPGNASAIDPLEQAFLAPPMAARPYVWWHWMGPNFSKAGITKDLEAMAAAGIGGATIFNITSGVRESSAPLANNPWPDQTYRSPAYWEAMVHAAAEAERLGLEIGLHNTVGYATTGGPWITQERNMQRIVSSEITVEGGRTVSVRLAQPVIPPHSRYGIRHAQPLTFYRDIAVLAVPAEGAIPRAAVVDLSALLRPDGSLEWDAPPGPWRIHRLGHAPTGAQPAPAPDDVIEHVLEADKMSAEQTRFHWENVLGPLRQHLAPHLGRSFGHLLIDSYEAGSQDWTPGFRRAFVERMGYDPVPWLVSRIPGPKGPDGKPTFRTIGSADETARFHHDFREVVAALYRQNGWEVGAAMVRAAGLALQFEAYGGPFDTVAGSALADLPMGEFWVPGSGLINGNIVGAARAAGRRVIAAEAFTGRPEHSHWVETPARLKSSADGFFSCGGNRLVLHHWVHQPFDDRYRPGLGMGWWGSHFGRHQTWFEPGKAFFAYLGRTQALLQRGEPTVEMLSVGQAVDGSDVIPAHVFLEELSVQDRQVVLPSGRRYTLLLVPHQGALTPGVVRRIGTLLEAGATVVAARPERSPSLQDYPACDAEVRALADRIWGTAPDSPRTVGAGRLLAHGDPARARRELGIAPLWTVSGDNTRDIRVSQRRDTETGAELFFVANPGPGATFCTLSCRLTGRLPELWNAEDGSRRPAPDWRIRDGRTEVDLALNGLDSVFVVFRRATALAGASTPRRKLVSTQAIDGPWQVSFAPGLETPARVVFPALLSWSEHADPAIRYFSGTATYRSAFVLDATAPGAGRRLELDLGEVRDLATVRLNGQPLRVLWRAPFVVDVTEVAKPGENQLEVEVCNTWHNRLVGDEQEPADIVWGGVKKLGSAVAGRPLEAYPDWFIKNQPRPSAGRRAFVTWNYFTADTPLLPAGLLGPVTLRIHGHELPDTPAAPGATHPSP